LLGRKNWHLPSYSCATLQCQNEEILVHLFWTYALLLDVGTSFALNIKKHICDGSFFRRKRQAKNSFLNEDYHSCCVGNLDGKGITKFSRTMIQHFKVGKQFTFKI
jgi:hypothetical protein